MLLLLLLLLLVIQLRFQHSNQSIILREFIL